MRFCSKPMRAMLAASSGMDRRGILRALRLERRGSNCESGTRIRFLDGSAISSGAAASMATASVLSTAFMVMTPCGWDAAAREAARAAACPCRVGIQAFNWRRPSASSHRARLRRTLWSMPCTGRVVWRRPFAARADRPPLVKILLRAVEHAPQVAAVVVVAARHQDLRFRDGRGLVLVVLQCQRSAGEHFRFPGVERDGAHGIAGFLRPVEAVQDFVSAFDDVPRYVALVGNAHVGHGVAADKAIAANEAEHPGQHLIAASAVMGVQQDDFVGLAAVDLAGVAQPDHVLRVVAAVVVAHAGLRHHERLEAFPAQFLQHGRGGDVAVPLRAAFVRGVREDGRGHGGFGHRTRDVPNAAPGNGKRSGMRVAWHFS